MTDREGLVRPAEDHLLVRHEPRQAHGVDRHLAAHPAGGRLGRPGRRSSFVSAWSSMISACGNERAASAANRIIRTAPRAKFGRHEARDPPLAGELVELLRAPPREPGVPITHGTPAESAASRCRDGGGRREVDGDVEAPRRPARRPRRPSTSWPAAASALIRTPPTLPSRPKSRISCRARDASRLTARPRPGSAPLGPMPAADRRSGA